MDGKHVVFGKLVEGLEVLKALEKVGEKNEKPKHVECVHYAPSISS